VERQDVRMGEPGNNLDLALEALRADSGGDFGVEDLNRDRATVLEVLGEEYSGHAAPAELTLDPVAAGEGVLQALRLDGQLSESL
jgi:hypothetical protein